MKRKLAAVAAIAVAAGGLAWVSFGDLGDNLVYYWSPTEMTANRDKAVGATIRLGGLVEAGSVRPEGTTLRFRVDDGTTQVDVISNGIPPQMFREGIGVVVEGTLGTDGTFQSSRMMVKHDNEYRAPVAGQIPDEKAQFGTLDEDG